MFNRPRKLELDYLASRRPPRWPGVLVLAVSLALAATLFSRWREAQLELARLDAAGMVSFERRAAPVPEARLAEEVKAAEAVVRSLALPWAALVRAVEQAATREVALLQLQPDPQARQLRLSAEARHREAMFAYVRRLASAEGLAEVHLVSHQVNRDDPQRPVQFSLQATLK
jgi:hypothetical protein